jgi:HPr kinase/phosphorylase
MGHDPARDFNDRLISFMSQQAGNRSATIKPLDREERP